MMPMGDSLMKKIILSIILILLLTSGVQANQENGINTNVERLTIRPDLQLDNLKLENLKIIRVDFYDDSNGNGQLVLTTETKVYVSKILKGGNGYYYEVVSGPLKKLQDEGKLTDKKYGQY